MNEWDTPARLCFPAIIWGSPHFFLLASSFSPSPSGWLHFSIFFKVFWIFFRNEWDTSLLGYVLSQSFWVSHISSPGFLLQSFSFMTTPLLFFLLVFWFWFLVFFRNEWDTSLLSYVPSQSFGVPHISSSWLPPSVLLLHDDPTSRFF